jgi:hypothetical protein
MWKNMNFLEEKEGNVKSIMVIWVMTQCYLRGGYQERITIIFRLNP